MSGIWLKIMCLITLGVIFVGCNNNNIEETKSNLDIKQTSDADWDNSVWDKSTWK